MGENTKGQQESQLACNPENKSFFKRFILFIWERERTQEWDEEQRERERILKRTPRWVQGPTWGSIPGPLEITTWATINNQTLNWSTQAPLEIFLHAENGVRIKWHVIPSQCEVNGSNSVLVTVHVIKLELGQFFKKII